MKTLVLGLLLVLATGAPAFATWSVIALDARTGQVIIASATCVRQAGFPQRQPNPARDLMDVQAVIVPGMGVAACQAGVDNTRENQMLVYNELKKGTPPADIIEMLKKDPNIERRQFGIAQRWHDYGPQQPRGLQRQRQLAVVALFRRAGGRHLLPGAGQHAAR
jgi:hypothetical protein